MEKFTIERDITVFYVPAATFPSGIGPAYKKLESFLKDPAKHIFYGISYPDSSGDIHYKAAVEESFPGEGAANGCNTFVIRKGIYISKLLIDWQTDETSIGRCFQQLLKYPELDKNGYCLEIYPNEKDVRCLVPLP